MQAGVGAVALEEGALRPNVALVGRDEQGSHLVDQHYVGRRGVVEVPAHGAPGVPQQELVAEPMSELGDRVAGDEPVAPDAQAPP